jgi:hypothetical protein
MEVDGRVAGIDSRAARDGGRSRWRTLAGYVCFSFLPTGRREKGDTAGKGAGQGRVDCHHGGLAVAQLAVCHLLMIS